LFPTQVPGIQRVINFDFPSGAGGAAQYVHRIGRTGRAGATGQADTLFTTAEAKQSAAELVRILAEAGQPVPDRLAAMARKAGLSLKSVFAR
jgi:superfamily II DNA/RNA helicase